jgi:hypothetical protein
MRIAAVLLFLLLSGWSAHGEKEPSFVPPLASGGAPECPEHMGVRNYKSEIAKYVNTVAYITGTASLGNSGCQRRAELHIEADGATRLYQLPVAKLQDFSIADFSPDGSNLLLFAERREVSSNEDFRDIEIAVVPVASGEMHWRNVWDIFQWQVCGATVEPQGFADEIHIALRARPSVINSKPRPDCISDVGLYSIDLAGQSVTRLPSGAEIQRYGSSTGAACQTCKKDPDIVSSCFTVHGRIFLANGSPSYRIWRIGTDRILGVPDSIVPEAIAINLTWENAAFGDFYVCPFTAQKDGEMQYVCVESASKIIFKKW